MSAASKPLRTGMGVGVGVVSAWLGAQVIGAYSELSPVEWLVTGPLFGLVLAEVVMGVGRDRTLSGLVAASALTVWGVLWGAWILTDNGVATFPALAWVSAMLGAGVAAWWVRGRRRPSTA